MESIIQTLSNFNMSKELLGDLLKCSVPCLTSRNSDSVHLDNSLEIYIKNNYSGDSVVNDI